MTISGVRADVKAIPPAAFSIPAMCSPARSPGYFSSRRRISGTITRSESTKSLSER